jgi:cytochrome c oxidase cbb3-type subunit 4
MIKNVIERIGGVDMCGIIAVVFFFVFFTVMLIWAFRLKKNYLNSMQDLPLDDGLVKNSTQNENSSHE